MDRSQELLNAAYSMEYALSDVLGRFDLKYLASPYSVFGNTNDFARIFMGIDSLFPHEDSMNFGEENPTFVAGQVPDAVIDCFAQLYARHCVLNAIEVEVTRMARVIHHITNVNHPDNTILQNNFINAVNSIVMEQLTYRGF